ncbi:MAG TPA: prephenate dehydrogenase [Candidatus Avidesulfovibrio excrementigallinarum]|nr:prephenate dehydrogenase [Candidatus Avidesulfovibrio excrementigallinarum]
MPGLELTTAERDAVLIVGARGQMGSMLSRRFRESGRMTVEVDTPLEEPRLHEACGQVQIVLLCVPYAALGDVLRRVTPHMRPGTVLADVTSVKELPMRQMERAWSGPVVGTHPLFGPVTAPGQPLRVAVTPGKSSTETALRRVEALFAGCGCQVLRVTAEQHDKAAARIQSMNFISTMVYLAMLAEDDSLLPFLTPSFQRRLAAGRKMIMEDAQLFRSLFEANPYSQEVVRQYTALLGVAAAGDIDLLTHRAQWWWRNHEREASAPFVR